MSVLHGPRSPDIMGGNRTTLTGDGNNPVADDKKATDSKADADERTVARRKFLTRAGQVAVTTPAVTLLLAAGTKRSANAGEPYVW